MAEKPLPPPEALCRFCGRTMAQRPVYRDERWERPNFAGSTDTGYDRVLSGYDPPGAEGNGHFCTYRCGMHWALRELQRQDDDNRHG